MKTSKNPTDPVRAYLREIGRVPLLTHEEEILYAKQVQRLIFLEKIKESLRAKLGSEPSDRQWSEAAEISEEQLRRELGAGDFAKRKMVEANLRLVVSVAKNT